MKKALHYVLTRVFNTPLLIHPHKLRAIESFLQTRMTHRIMEDDDVAPEAEVSVEVGGRSGSELTPLGQVAIIPIYGTLLQRPSGAIAESGLMSYVEIERMLAEAVNDTNISAILLDVDSCGGEANGCFELTDRIFEARKEKPIIGIANEQAFSGGYALLSAAQKVYTTKTGNVGSVGVVCTHFDYSKMAEKEGVTITHIYAGKRKVDGSPYKPLTDTALKRFQGEINQLYDVFADTVARNRGLSVASVRGTEAGTYMGRSALSAGLVDEIISLADLPAKIEESIMAKRSSAGTSVSAPQNPVIEDPKPTGQEAAAPDASAVGPGDEEEDDEDPKPGEDEEGEDEEVVAPKPAPAASAEITARATAAEITRMCVAAGKPGLAAKLIESGKTAAQAKIELFDALVEEGGPAHVNALDAERAGASEGETLMVSAMRKLNDSRGK